MQFLDTNLKNIKKNVKFLIFDLDGTLIKSNEIILKAFKSIFPKTDDKKIIKEFGPPSKKVIKLLNPKLKEKEILILNNLFEKKYYNYLKKNIVFEEETKNILYKLKEKYKLGIITSSKKKAVLLSLRNEKKMFDIIITSGVIKTSKPNPKTLKYIIKKYDLKNKNIVYIGDNIKDIIFGKNAKVYTIAKIDFLYNKKELLKYNPDLIIKKISDLKCLI